MHNWDTLNENFAMRQTGSRSDQSIVHLHTLRTTAKVPSDFLVWRETYDD